MLLPLMRRVAKPLSLIIVPLMVTLVAYIGRLSLRQLIALFIFSFEITGITLYWEHKLAFAFMGLLLFFVTGVLDLTHFVKFVYIDVIFFLMCMMIVVWYLEDRGFFEYLVEILVERIGRNAYKLTVTIMLLSAVFSSLVGVVTTSLFMVPMVLRLALSFRVNPIPFILMCVFSANIGSSATLMGNPVGVVLALRAHLTFHEFLRWATPITTLSLIVTILVCMRLFRRHIEALNRNLKVVRAEEGREEESIEKREVLKCWALLISVVALVVMHDNIEAVLNLEEGVMLIGSALFGATMVLFLERERIRGILESGIDWYVLLFFGFLFASIGALEYAGITEILAENIGRICGGDLGQLLVTSAFTCGILSALMDNVLAITLFVPVIHSLQKLGVEVYPLWWGILFASTYFGNFTVIASTANIIAVSLLESRKVGVITFTEWIKYGALVSLVSLSTALIMLYIQVI